MKFSGTIFQTIGSVLGGTVHHQMSEKVEKFSYDYAPLKNKKGKHYRVTNKLHLYSAGGAFQNTLGTLFQCESIDFFDGNGEPINKSRDK